jgi:hypothetical protein
MEDLGKQAELMHKTAGKILKILENLDEPTAIAVVNYIFLLMIIDDEKGPIVAKAMAATFINNVMNSVNSYFHAEHDECEHVH